MLIVLAVNVNGLRDVNFNFGGYLLKMMTFLTFITNAQAAIQNTIQIYACSLCLHEIHMPFCNNYSNIGIVYARLVFLSRQGKVVCAVPRMPHI